MPVPVPFRQHPENDLGRRFRLERNCASGAGGYIPRRRYAEVPDKGARHVALVREAGPLRGARGRLAGQEQLPRQPHAALDNIGVRRGSQLAGKGAHEFETG